MTTHARRCEHSCGSAGEAAIKGGLEPRRTASYTSSKGEAAKNGKVAHEKKAKMPSDPNWLAEVNARLEGLRRLPPDWDGFGGEPPRDDVVRFARELLQSVMTPTTPAPHIAPMSHEGLQLEWHIQDVDLEVEIEEPGMVSVLYHDPHLGRTDEIAMTNDFSALAAMIGQVTELARIRRRSEADV
jgi:hypothetical protein